MPPPKLYKVRIEVDPEDWFAPSGIDPQHPHVTTQEAVEFYRSIGWKRNARINVNGEMYWFLKDEWPQCIEILGDEPPKPWAVNDG